MQFLQKIKLFLSENKFTPKKRYNKEFAQFSKSFEIEVY